MAEPLIRDPAIPLMEDAVRLLRQAPLSTLVCHWTGSVPFALVALAFWNDLTNPRTLDSTGALEAFLLALTLVWMNSWRAVFAGRLRRQLSGTATVSWTPRRVWRLLAGQAFFGATKLVLLPIAWIVIFPLASTIAFYRNIAVLADRDGLDPLELMAKARQLALVQPAQSWALVTPLAFLQLLIAINLAITLGVLPQLVRVLTGYESSFSRSGSLFASNPLFFLLVIAVSWIAFDPFIQAVYCVRCFRAESLETGEDLRSGLRRIAAGVPALALVLFFAVAQHAAAVVPPGELEKSVQRTMQSHEYDWRLPPPSGAPKEGSWLVRLADRILAGFKTVSDAIGNAFHRLMEWIKGKRAAPPPTGEPPVTGLHWSLYAAIGVVLLVAGVILWRGWQARRPKAVLTVDASSGLVRLDAEDLTPDRLPEERWLELADECLRDGNHRLALRALYLANLAWLGRTQWITIDAGKTNREYELELKRRARSFPDVRAPFVQNLAAFERAWYGLHEVDGGDIETFRARVAQMKTTLPARESAAA